MAVGGVRDGLDEQRHTAHQWWGLETEAAVAAPEAHALSNVASLVEAVCPRSRGAALARHIGAVAVVGVFTAEELPGQIIVNLHPQACRCVTVIVRADKSHVLPGRRDDAGDFVRALLRRRTWCTLRNIVLGNTAADTKQAVNRVRVDMTRWLVFLEVPAPTVSWSTDFPMQSNQKGQTTIRWSRYQRNLKWYVSGLSCHGTS